MDTFTAIAEPTRRRILDALVTNGNLSATEIYKKFKSSPPAISQHLKVLRDAKLVRVEKRAQQRIYYINPEPMKQMEKWIQKFTANMEDQYQRLDRVLEIEKQKLSAKKEKENK